MKKSLFRLSLLLAAILVLFAGCRKDKYDEDMIIGSWDASDGYVYIFHSDHTGSSTKDGRGLDFDWSLDEDELELRYHGSGEFGKPAYQTFVIESLSSSKMEAYDKNDYEEETITFTKK